jgi:pSer/pThr/pTyr-binding forkhead associated (FHA) protein
MPAAGGQPSLARLVLIRPDGTEGGAFQLNEGSNRIGRDAGPLFASDSFLSPRHVTFTVAGSSVVVRDEGALNGVYVRIDRQAPVELHDGDVFRIGQEILRFDAFHPVTPLQDGTEVQGAQIEGLVGRISLIIGRDVTGNSFPIPITGLYLGRERGDILFPEDGYVSGLHCQISVENGAVTITDVGSSNGSYLRIRGERKLNPNDLLLMGQQLFRLTMG